MVMTRPAKVSVPYIRRPAHLFSAFGQFPLLALLVAAPVTTQSAAGDARFALAKPADLFVPTNVWHVHLRFTPDQWEAMEPRQDGILPFGGFRRFGGPPDERGPFGPVVGLRPAAILARVLLEQGDQNTDGKLSRGEFLALAAKWFSEWDADKNGKVTVDELRAGLNTSLPGAMHFGGSSGRGPGRNLQGPEGKRNGLASAAGIEFSYVHADLEFEGRTFKDVAVRYKGNGTFMRSRSSLKRSLKVDLNKYVKGQKLAGLSRLNFHNNVADPSWMNEVLSHRLYREAGVPAARTAYARVYLTVPGKYDREYVGLYSMVEDLDKEFASEIFGSSKGAIFKPVTPDLFSDLGSDWRNYNQTYDPKTRLTPGQMQRVMDFCKFVNYAKDADFAARLPEYLDLDEFARFMAVTVWLSTLDSILAMGQNFYVYLTENGHFKFLPWDLDHSFGQFGMRGSQEQRENLNIYHPWQGDNRFLERVFNVNAFQTLYLTRFKELDRTLFKPERFSSQVDELARSIRPAVEEESAEKLDRFDLVVAGEAFEMGGFGGRGFGSRQPGKPIKSFVFARAQSVSEQLAGKGRGASSTQVGFEGRRGGGSSSALGEAFMTEMDLNRDGRITRQEFADGFARWFERWNSDKTGLLTEEQLRSGIDREFWPVRSGPPGAQVAP
jgi:spore coat protein CotH